MSIESYIARLNAQGSDIQNSTENISKINVRNQIMNSLTRKTVTLNGVDQYSIVSDRTNYEIRTFLFLPDVEVFKGDYIEYENFTYLTIDNTLDTVYPQSFAYLCNFNFPIRTEEVRTITGYTNEGRPKYNINSVDITTPCVFTNREFSKIDNTSVSIPNGEAIVYIPYSALANENPRINKDISYRGYSYRITDIRYDNVLPFKGNDRGYLELRLQRESVSNA